MHAIGTHIFLSLATNGELRGETVPLRHISYELQPRSKRHRLPDWLVSGWWSNAPFLNFKEWVNNLWLREDAHPLGVACGIWGRSGHCRLLNWGTEIQEFQDDVPKAVNQMPETNEQNNLEEVWLSQGMLDHVYDFCFPCPIPHYWYSPMKPLMQKKKKKVSWIKKGYDSSKGRNST